MDVHSLGKGKIVCFALRGLRREKSPAPSGIRTHDLSVMRRCKLYHCATTAALLSILDPCARWLFDL